MADEKTKPSREDVLAAKLRENLRRRKAQARAMGQPAAGDGKVGLPKTGPNG